MLLIVKLVAFGVVCAGLSALVCIIFHKIGHLFSIFCRISTRASRSAVLSLKLISCCSAPETTTVQACRSLNARLPVMRPTRRFSSSWC
ncbi:MAG: hypothetical protein ACLUDF_03995 [Butyricicoccus sp.]